MAYTMTLPGKLATQTGVPIILTAGERLPGGRGWRIHYVRVPEPLPADPQAQAALLNAAMETLIRRCPQQYLWSYNRYKTPRGAPRRQPTTPPPPPAEAVAPFRPAALVPRFLPMNDSKTRTLVSLLKWFGRMRPANRQRIGAALGWLAMRLARSRTRIVRRNLELCFPNSPRRCANAGCANTSGRWRSPSSTAACCGTARPRQSRTWSRKAAPSASTS